MDRHQLTNLTLSTHLGTDEKLAYCVCVSFFLSFFSFFLASSFCGCWLFQWVSCTVHETYKPLFSTKYSLKIGSTTLFTHLKIILLQYFQFSVFNKISGIQIHPQFVGLCKKHSWSQNLVVPNYIIRILLRTS